MSPVPQDLRYTKDHEWARIEADGTVVVGITGHAVEQLGDITMVSLPEPGTALEQGRPFGDVDSVKAVSELFAPIDGEVVAINGALDDAPESVNEDPYGRGWMLRLRPRDASQVGALLTAAQYGELLGSLE
jgi:glycine cleavage system H protein